MKDSKRVVRGYHVLYNGWLGNGDLRYPNDGEWITAHTRDRRPVEKPRLCAPGMHAYSDIKKAVVHAARSTGLAEICLVEVRGGIAYGRHKFVGRERRILARITLEALVRAAADSKHSIAAVAKSELRKRLRKAREINSDYCKRGT